MRSDFQERMIVKVQAVVNAELYDAAKKSDIVEVVGGKTVEYTKTFLPEKADQNGIFSSIVKACVLTNFHYARLVAKELRGGEDSDNPWAKVFCLPDGNPLRPFFHHDGRQTAMFTTKCLVAIYANSKGWLNIALEWIDESEKTVHHKPLLCGTKSGKLCAVFFTSGIGEKLQKAIAGFLKENIIDLEVPGGLEFNFNPENLAPAVAHALLKANGYKPGIFADLSRNGRYKTARPVVVANGNGHDGKVATVKTEAKPSAVVAAPVEKPAIKTAKTEATAKAVPCLT